MSAAAPTILVIEDHRDLRALIRLAVLPVADEVIEVSNTREGWQLLETRRPNVVLLDVNLETPRDGLTLCRRIKDSEYAAETRVILITTAAQDADVQRGFEAGADSYVVKPFSPAELLDVVRAQHA